MEAHNNRRGEKELEVLEEIPKWIFSLDGSFSSLLGGSQVHPEKDRVEWNVVFLGAKDGEFKGTSHGAVWSHLQERLMSTEHFLWKQNRCGTFCN